MKNTNMDSISAYAERVSASEELVKVRVENKAVINEINDRETQLAQLRKERDLLKIKCEGQKVHIALEMRDRDIRI